MKKNLIPSLLAVSVFCCLSASAETEWGSSGDLRCFRYQGEPVDITTSVRMGSPDGSQTGQAQLQTTGRSGTRLVFTGNLNFGTPAAPGSRGGGGGGRGVAGRGGGGGGGGASLRVQIDDTSSDTTTFEVQASTRTAIPLDGIYYWLNLGGANFANGSVELVPSADAAPTKVSLASLPAGSTNYADATVKSIRITGTGNRVVEVSFANPTHIILRESRGGARGSGGDGGRGARGGTAYSLLIPIGTGTLNPGTPFHAAFTLKASCDIDTTPIKLTVDPSRTGPAFIGIGGNFRLQSPADTAVIAYNLENLRVAWARLEMPLSSWQTTEAADPAAGQPADKVRQAMEMARTLAQKKIPMMISDWSVPSWAAATNGGRGQIAADKWPTMYKGITSYLAYLKKHYGAEPLLFSFNEADMGINVKLAPEDQRTIIKGLGAAFAAEGLATKMLLGDTGNPTPRPANYLEPSIADPEAMKYVGAVSYHCWTGGSDQIIAHWGQIAQRFKLPLYVAEGGTDPASYRYRFLFLEPWYALDEINLYMRCLALSQPASILHWQLTDDYSILAGGRNGQPLQPTQRFFNLKQLNLTPPEAPSLGIASDRPRITAAAYGDATHGWAIHLVNIGTTRAVMITGLPASLTQLYPTVTDSTRNMKALAPVPVSGGTAPFTLDCQSYVTLTSTKP